MGGLGDLRKQMRQDAYEDMVRDLGRSRTLGTYQYKLAGYKDKNAQNYFKAVIDSKTFLMNRIQKRYNKLTNAQKVVANKYIGSTKETSSPVKLFNTLAKMKRFDSNQSWRFK